MTLDDKLLAAVHEARDRLELLEDQAWEARAELHRTIRALHSAGGSLREIADALGMSHQRVHQIVGEDAVIEVEPTPVDVLPLSDTHVPAVPEDACSFCHSPRREVDRLLAGPGRRFICGTCIGRAAAAVAGEALAPGGFTPLARVSGSCSFCGRSSATAAAGAPGAAGAARAAGAAGGDGEPVICERCVAACQRAAAGSRGGGSEEPRPGAGGGAGQGPGAGGRTEGEAAGSTPRRGGGPRRRETPLRCSFCNASQKDVAKLIAGPGTYICGECIAAASTVAQRGEPAAGPRQVTMTVDIRPCGFCRKKAAQVDTVVRGGRGLICDECLDLCNQILAEDT